MVFRSAIVLLCVVFAAPVAWTQQPPEPPAEAPQRAAGGESLVERVANAAKGSIAVVSVEGRDGQQFGIGTGFVISADGLIATNLHVIGEARPIQVQMADGRKFAVREVYASDRALDLAILRVDAKDLPPLELGRENEPRQGEPIVVLGNPQGLKHSVVGGVVSGMRDIEGRQMLQLAVPIEPGNSGGPVLDSGRRVLGVVTMKSAVTANLGFAVPVADLQSLLAKPNPVPIDRWLTIGAIDEQKWRPRFGAQWRQRAGRILVREPGEGFGGRSLCLWRSDPPKTPYEVGVWVKLDDEADAAGLVFHADGGDKHYGFYPSAGKLRLTRFSGPSVYTWNVLFNEASPHYRLGEWNYLKVRVEKDRIRCFVNDELVVESKDNAFTTGKVGLAKFRQTRAEFKQFRLADKLPPTQLPAARVAKLTDAIDALPDLPDLLPTDLDALVKDSADSSEVLRAQSRQLEERARKLEQLAADIHTHAGARALADALRGPDEQIDLARAALLAARLDDEEIDVEAYLADLERMAGAISDSLPKDADEAKRIAALDEYLFSDNGFHGSRTNYYHRANSYLNRVIDDREGLPITLSVLYIELGRRLGLKIEGVGLPAHFVVRHVPAKGEPQLIDVFERGHRLSRREAEQMVVELTGAALDEQFLKPVERRAIVRRMLGNLLGIAQRARDREAMLRYLEGIVAIAPDSTGDRGMRAVIRFETGRRRAAIADLDWFLDNEPEGVDLEKIREMREYFQHNDPPR